jgi:capsule biosynthesis phosphatase
MCGGIGSRLEDYSFPKPLNMIYGKPSITYTLMNLPKYIHTIYFIVAPHLEEYNFREIVINTFKDRNCIFLPLAYFTRGPIESAWCGTVGLPNDTENIVFLDNDVMYEFPDNFFQEKSNAFLGYSIDNTSSEAYSFIQLHNTRVIAIKEKKRISNKYSCGIYGFKSLEQFRKVALNRLTRSTDSELYLSLLFEDLIFNNEVIEGIQFPSCVTHIGSLQELKSSRDKIPTRKMRICFDLDNTLVTYPSVPGDYTSVKPINSMIQYAKMLHNEGHTIIIHTARRMATHNNNIGAVIKDIGKLTFDTLDKFEIPYDELIFGKPIADIYIDDRAVNPYRNDMASMGIINYEKKDIPLNKLQNNKYNKIELRNGNIIKHGLYDFLKGEINFYETFPKDISIHNIFPKFYGSTKYNNGTAELHIEYIKGIPFYTLYKSELLTEYHIQQLFDILDRLHAIPGKDIPSRDEIYDNYIGKLKTRFTDKEIYYFSDSAKYQSKCLDNLEIYLQTTPKSVPYIHGDFWFSNILLDFKNNIKLIDMKGRLESRLTLGGDIMYDYGKLYQSILGYDLILNNEAVSSNYSNTIKEYFLNEIRKRDINITHLQYVTISLMMGTLHSIESKDKRQIIWNWLTNNEIMHHAKHS